jgi:hypothetical protein
MFAQPMSNKTSILKTTTTFSFNLDHINFYKDTFKTNQYNISFLRVNSPSYQEIYYNHSEGENSVDDISEADEDDISEADDDDDSIHTEILVEAPIQQQVVGIEFFINEESDSDSDSIS